MAARYESDDIEQKSRTLVTQWMILVLFFTGVFLLLGQPAGYAAWPGLMARRSTLFDDLAVLLQVGAVIGMWIGTGFARDGRIYAHQYTLTASVVLHTLVMILVILPGGRPIGPAGLVFLVLALLAMCGGFYLLLRMYRLLPRSMRVSWWRSLMRVVVLLYTLAAVMAVVIYAVTFIL